MKQLHNHIHQPIPQQFNIPDVDEGHAISTPAEQYIQMIMIKDPAKGCKPLFRMYLNMLCNHAMRFVYSKEIAEDLVNEVFCRLLKSWTYEAIKSSYGFYSLPSLKIEANKYKSLNDSVSWTQDRFFTKKYFTSNPDAYRKL